MTRKLASVRKILDVKSIQGADKICAYSIDGWWVVDSVGKYNVGQLVIYLEPDSWVPHDLAPFLTKPGHEPKEFEGIKGQRLRTIKLRGQLSQGLVLPLSVLMYYFDVAEEGADATEILGIKKWEKALHPSLAGTARGNFPTLIPKTDQDRIQNKRREFNQEFRQHEWEVTEKLHGSSATYFLDPEGVFHVCSRNLDLKFDENNAYWKIAIKYDIENQMRAKSYFGYAIQGELIGEGINGNQYGIQGLDFYVFDVYHVGDGYLTGDVRHALVTELGLKHVPVLDTYVEIEENNLDFFIAYADGPSALNGSNREGLVWKSERDGNVSFKVVSNKWLLGGGEDQ